MVAVELRTREPIVDLRLLGNRLFRAGNGVMVLASVAFLGTLFAISLYYQDGRGLNALGSGLSTFPEALGVMAGAQLASRLLYPRLGPRRHITIGLVGVGGVDRPAGPDGSAHQPVVGAAAHAHPGAVHGAGVRPGPGRVVRHHHPGVTGRASTMFNAIRQLGGAIGVALLTTVIVAVGPVHLVAGHLVANLNAYRAAFLAAAAICLCGVASSLAIHDADAAATIPGRRQPDLQRAPEPRAA